MKIKEKFSAFFHAFPMAGIGVTTLASADLYGGIVVVFNVSLELCHGYYWSDNSLTSDFDHFV